MSGFIKNLRRTQITTDKKDLSRKGAKSAKEIYYYGSLF